jgi:hypothetical protein
LFNQFSFFLSAIVLHIPFQQMIKGLSIHVVLFVSALTGRIIN